MKIVLCNIPSIVMLGTSAYLVANSLPGWGWFLGLGFLAIALPSKGES